MIDAEDAPFGRQKGKGRVKERIGCLGGGVERKVEEKGGRKNFSQGSVELTARSAAPWVTGRRSALHDGLQQEDLPQVLVEEMDEAH
jgi:hypothetical protein